MRERSYSKNKKCVDCNKLISNKSTRCNRCSTIFCYSRIKTEYKNKDWLYQKYITEKRQLKA